MASPPATPNSPPGRPLRIHLEPRTGGSASWVARAGMAVAVAEWMCLASCRAMIKTSQSSYSDEASIMHDLPVVALLGSPNCNDAEKKAITA